jgi:hypothetical protein
MAQDTSPLTGIIEEDKVFIDFGEHEGKSVFEIQCIQPDYYQFLLQQKETGNFAIKRTKEKIYKLYISQAVILN